MTWLDIAGKCGAKAQSSAPPARWYWVAMGGVAVFIAGWLVSKEQELAAEAKADIELKKKRAEELITTSKAAKTDYAAEALVKAAQQTLREVALAEAHLEATRAVIAAKKEKLKQAMSWEDLENA